MCIENQNKTDWDKIISSYDGHLKQS